jgi:two-component system cell cycle response regulator
VPSVLIVDDPSPVRDALVELLRRAGHNVTLAADSDEGLVVWRAQRHEVALLAASSGRIGGTELAARMKAETAQVYAPVLLVVGRNDVDARIEGLSVADDVLARPYLAAEAHARLEALLRTKSLVDQLRAARAESESRSIADGVTGLRNRLFLGERLNEEFKRSVRYNEPLSLIILNVERLRELTAERGTGFGDRVLLAIANAALRSLRQIDVVCRYGPTELAALLPNTHFAGSLICAERIHREAARSIVDDFVPTVSMGISFYPGKDVADPADLLKLGSRALERACEEGPGNICLYQHQGYLFQPKSS